MLKKILGEAPFDVSLEKRIIITPGKKTVTTLLFSNTSEYDLPLSCSLNFSVSIDTDKTAFDVTVPAEGNTSVSLIFSKDADSRMFTGKGIAELEIVDRIFDSKTLYEFEILCESAYKCAGINDGFSASDNTLFTSCGRFFANKDEAVFIEIPCMEDTEYRLCILSGKIKKQNNGDLLKLTSGLNRIIFEMSQDGSFEFQDTVSGEAVYADTINTKHFI